MIRSILTVGHNDIRLFLREKTAFIWLFIVPLAFTYFMGLAFKGPGGPEVGRASVLVENNDPGFLGRAVVDELGSQGLTLLNPTNKDSAKRVIRIPADLTDTVLQEGRVKLQFSKKDDADEQASMLVQARLFRALLALNAAIVEYAGAHDGKPPTEEGLAEIRKRDNPVKLSSTHAGRKPIPSGYNLSLPGNLVMYVMMNLLIFGGATVASERREGVLKRIVIHPVTRGALVLGKIYGLVLLGIVQIAVFLIVGRVLFGVNVGDQLPAIFLTMVIYAWVAAALGVLIGSALKAEEKVVPVCLVLSMTMGALGGCWWPLEIVPDFMKTVAHFVPSTWALEALHQLISFGAGIGQAKVQLGVLILFGLGANIAAAKCFRV